MKALLVAGARPNFMKAKPVLDALEERSIECLLVHTGQHYDRLMSDVFFDDLRLRAPDRHLGAGSGTHAEQTARVMVALEGLLEHERPDVVVVFGDVNSTLAAAIVGAKAGTLVAHVEAGLRSRDWRMPEEINRVVADRVSDLLFAPSGDAMENLRREGYREDQLHLVGNVMVDTLLGALDRALARPTLEAYGVAPGSFGLVTLHRPENVDDAATLTSLVGVLDDLGAELPLLLPAHPRLTARIDRIEPQRLRLVEPVGYLDFVALEAQARVVLTDSGGVQEETTVLGVPCLTMRDTTERPITVTEGTNTIVGTDPERIRAAFESAVRSDARARRPRLWDGHAGRRIAEVLAGVRSPHLRPTALPPPPPDR